MRLLLLDNFDSFTFTLADYLRQLGAEVAVRRNDVPLADLHVPDYHGVVLSPGPGTPAAYGGFFGQHPDVGVDQEAHGSGLGFKWPRTA